MGIGTISLLAFVVAGLVLVYFTRDKLKRRALEWLTMDPVKGEIEYTFSESTTAAFEEVRKKLQKKHPQFELVKFKVYAGDEKTILEYSNMSKEELLRSGEKGYGVYGRLVFFKVIFKTTNETDEVTAKCRVESSKPGVWKAAFVEFDGATRQTGHPQKREEPAAQMPVAKISAVEIDDTPSVEDIAKEAALLPILASQEPVRPTSPSSEKTPEKPKRVRRQRSANAIGAMSEL